MTGPTVTLTVAVGVLFATGFHLMLQRSLIRIVVGFMLLGHGANLALLLAGGPSGAPPLLGGGDDREMADPLPQAMALTAIVITFAVTAFLLALAYRSRLLTGEDEVQDDVEDRRICAEEHADPDTWTGDPVEGNKDPARRDGPPPGGPAPGERPRGDGG
ncbi:Na(+)/H(+) antiporter subunit C [Actinomadura sp. WMMB 499]|uniref:Na(+)/H(+) antiporter subunit C n=1 Tax=Actinomadura sp. WMMB 499 TaxID=1219491 RepID=UPI0012463DBE|nr:Na(+)/H(+) antiporter subunit C [Actinomadura sp. WMMB 499]QFG21651.1 Na(+)/H(+) antiporter subunit C [Actinomadura sp. WMMB 499]